MKFLIENKYFSISLLVTIVISTFFFFQIKNDFFPDAIIQNRGEDYAKTFVTTAKGVEKGLLEFKGNIDSVCFFDLSNEEKIKFLTYELNANEKVNGLLILDHTGRFSTMFRDQNTYIFASDSASKIENVTWYRVDKQNKVLNSWAMALGLELNMLSKTSGPGKSSLVLNKLEWSSSNRLFGSINNNVANHISWKGKNTGEIITCFAILNEESFLFGSRFFNNNEYQSFLVNSNDQILTLHHVDKLDTINGKGNAFATATKSWEITGKNIPGTFSFSFNTDFWWGQAVLIPIDGIKGMVLSMSQQALYYSTFIDHVVELIIIVLLNLLSLFLFIRLFRKPHQSLAEFTRSQSNDRHASELIKQGETSQLEFKSSFRYDYNLKVVNKDLESVIAKSIAAFSNASGGTLLIGVNDDGQVLGLENDINTLKRKDIDFFENTLRAFLNKTFSVSFVTQNLVVKFPVIDHKAICRIDTTAGSEPVFVEINKKGNKSERFYLRSGNTSQEIVSLREINDYIKDRFQ